MLQTLEGSNVYLSVLIGWPEQAPTPEKGALSDLTLRCGQAD